MYIALYYGRIIDRQELRWNEILMVDQVDLGIILIEPFRFLPIGYKMYFSYPWRKLVNPSKQILLNAIVSEAVFRNSILGVVLVGGIFGKFGLPLRVVHVNPCNYKINFHISVSCVSQ